MMNVMNFPVVLVCVTLAFASAVLAETVSADENQAPFTQETAVDFGVDVTDDHIAPFLKAALVNATLSDDTEMHQYTDSNGHIRFLTAVAKLYSRIINQTLDPLENVMATVGATEGLASAFQSLTNPGDEWILIEPFWPKFRPQIELAHGVLRYTNLKLNKTGGDIRGSDWHLDKEEFASLFNSKTRGIILNNPNNPSGHVYTRDELEFIADLAERWDVTVVTDEAHEWAVYEPAKLIKFATLPGMFNRTITVGTGSKTFNVAGWRIGWVYGPGHLITRLSYNHDYVVQNAPMPQQIAIAYAFEQELENFGTPNSYFQINMRHAKSKRDLVASAFREAGLEPIVPDGGYCMMASWPGMDKHQDSVSRQIGGNLSVKLQHWLIKYIGILGFPVWNYYGDEHKRFGEKYVRFCFHKANATVQAGADNVMRLKSYA